MGGGCAGTVRAQRSANSPVGSSQGYIKGIAEPGIPGIRANTDKSSSPVDKILVLCVY
ncbi:hypothetical protein NITHO_4210004 [Nitrolancea hollandica Lb]|uniref:Uncharacterized protein n=1 Tax=Nitrolancea hollandica Lb TaxID=1129897 RepID=I4EJR5_9BACT|nr:hypothetical protein NITHO_4210004 [Nitrolancea hollandica Lb]